MEDEQIADIFANAGLVPLPHPNLPSDPVMTEMVRLKTFPLRERSEALEPYMEGWIQRETETLAVARYLAAAGLNYDDAAQLEHLVRSRVRADWRARARIDFYRAFGAFVTAGILLVVETFSRASFPGFAFVLIAFSALGIGMLARSIRLMRRITAASDEIL